MKIYGHSWVAVFYFYLHISGENRGQAQRDGKYVFRGAHLVRSEK